MMKLRGRVVSRAMLARDVWKDVNRATSLDNVIDVHISRLRKKVDDNRQNELLCTVRGIGFCLSEHDRDRPMAEDVIARSQDKPLLYK
jgi:DNA-binding response OmpR family regulator